MDTTPAFTEHHIAREHGRVYARSYAGTGPAFVLMHGFPDNLHIYDDLIPYLVAAGRHVVTFDFLGFGASDKMSDAVYSFAQQLGDLEAVVDALTLGSIVPVAHDSSGLAAINFTLAHPERVDWLCILNSGYDDGFPTHWPEMITLFATGILAPLSLAIAQSPATFGWLLDWQRLRFRESLSLEQQLHFDTATGLVIANNFLQTPSSGPAFMQTAALFFAELARNSARLPEVEALDVPVKLIWGEHDPYFTAAVRKTVPRTSSMASCVCFPRAIGFNLTCLKRSHAKCYPEPQPHHPRKTDNESHGHRKSETNDPGTAAVHHAA